MLSLLTFGLLCPVMAIVHVGELDLGREDGRGFWSLCWLLSVLDVFGSLGVDAGDVRALALRELTRRERRRRSLTEPGKS